MTISDLFAIVFYYGLIALCLAPFGIMIGVVFYGLLEYIADSDIWVRKKDRDE